MNDNNNLNNQSVTNNNAVPPTPVLNSQQEKFMTVEGNQVQPVITNNQSFGNQQVVQQPVVQQAQVQGVPQQVQTTPTPVQTQTVSPDNNGIVNEKLKKVEIKDYTPPSKAKIVLLLIFFILLVVFIMFLPNISSLVRNYKSGATYEKTEVITTGKLICTLKTNTTDLDNDYEFSFSFIESKLQKVKYIMTTKGDSTVDVTTLDELNDTCTNLEKETKDLDGVSIRCDYSDGKLVETQNFNLETVDTEKLDAAFTEAGGMKIGYQFNQNIDGIEKNMKASGYTCERQK